MPVAELSNQALAVLGDAHAAVGRIDDLLSKPDVEAALHNAASASGRLDGLLADPGLTETVNNVAAISARLRKLVSSGDMDRLVKSLDAAATRLSGLIGDNQFDVRVIVQDLRVAANNIRVLSDSVKRNPAGVLLGGPPRKFSSGKIAMSARYFVLSVSAALVLAGCSIGKPVPQTTTYVVEMSMPARNAGHDCRDRCVWATCGWPQRSRAIR